MFELSPLRLRIYKRNGLDVATYHRPKKTGVIGSLLSEFVHTGDMCKFIDSNGEYSLVISDVMGTESPKEFPEYVLQMRKKYKDITDPAYILKGVNSLICKHNEEKNTFRFVSAIVAIIDNDGNVRFSNAGHEQPIIIRNGYVFTKGGYDAKLALGIDINEEYDVNEIKMDTGDVLFLYTDGIADSKRPVLDENGNNKQNEKGVNLYESYGFERLSKVLKEAYNCHSRDVKEMAKYLINDFNDFCSDDKGRDDQAFIIVKKV